MILFAARQRGRSEPQHLGLILLADLVRVVRLPLPRMALGPETLDMLILDVAPGADLGEIAKKAEIAPRPLYRWREGIGPSPSSTS